MIRRAWLAAVLVPFFFMAACGADGAPDQNDEIWDRVIELDDGRTVTCVVHEDGYRGGITCDWESAK